MGQKTHPIGFRLGIIKGGRSWDSSWFASKSENYKQYVEEDIKIRSLLRENYQDAGIAKISIERGAELVVTLHTARPGIVIGRGGTRIDQLREEIEKMTRTFKLGNKSQEHNLIDALKIASRKFTKEKTGKKPFTNINLVKI